MTAARAEFDALIGVREQQAHERGNSVVRNRTPAERADDEPALVVDVEGFEGPLDLLLALARQQKVDLPKISILALADQYLVFIEAARKLRLELAADYLVMAAWLAYLKSRLLLPEPATPDGPSAEDMATALALRLRRLEAIREASNRLMSRPQLRARHLSARRARADRRDQASGVDRDALRSALRLCRAAPEARARALCIWPSARCGRLPRRASRAGAAGRACADDWGRLDEYLIDLCGRAVAARDRVRVELRGGARNGARGRRWNCISKRRSRRSICASATPQPAAPIRRRGRTPPAQ